MIINYNLKGQKYIIICDPLKYTIGSPIHIVSICMGKSISIQRVKGSCPVPAISIWNKVVGAPLACKNVANGKIIPLDEPLV